MKKTIMFSKICFILMMLILNGCAFIKNTPATIAGYSFNDLEHRRQDALYQIYDASIVDCYHAVLTIAKENQHTIYYQNLERSMIVLMDIPGAVNTTEVGVFFKSLEHGKVKVEIVSRSSFAKKTVANFFFAEIQKRI